MKYEEQKNRTMKTFEEIYRDAAVRNGCNAGKTLLKEAVLTGYDLQKDDFDED